MNMVTLTVPAGDYNALTRASDFFHGLALDVDRAGPGDVVAPEPVEPLTEDDLKDATEEARALMTPDVTDPLLKNEPDNSPPLAEVTTPPAPPAPPLAEVFADTPAPAADLDANGLPWDPRIHASTKTQVTAGTWKRKRGVDPDTLAAVESELQATMSAAAPTPAPTAAPGMTFGVFMTLLTASEIPAAAVAEALKAHGIAALPLLAARPDLIAAVADDLTLAVAE